MVDYKAHKVDLLDWDCKLEHMEEVLLYILVIWVVHKLVLDKDLDILAPFQVVEGKYLVYNLVEGNKENSLLDNI